MAATSILELTDTDAAIGSAGLDRSDLTDQAFMKTKPEDDLELDLLSRNIDFATVIAEGGADTATLRQRARLKALQNYAKWFCATLICKRWLTIVASNSDGKTRIDRFDRMDLSLMQANAAGEAGKALGQFTALYDATDPARPTLKTPPKLFGLSTPTTDPVTDTTD